MTNNIWTDRDELDRINEVFENEFNFIKLQDYTIRERTNNKFKLGNIGLYSGNKMRELYRYFHEKDVFYSESKINRVIELYFIQQYRKAIRCLRKFAEEYDRRCLNSNKSKKQIMMDLLSNSEDIKEYQKLCHNVYSFDIEKDIDVAINTYIDISVASGWYSEKINSWIDEYNEELKELGINKKIEHRNVKESSTILLDEVTDREMVTIISIYADDIRHLNDPDMDDMFDVYEEIEEEEDIKTI